MRAARQIDVYMLLLCICKLFFVRDRVFAFELGIGAIAGGALTRLMNRDRSLPGRQEAIAQNLITKGTSMEIFQQPQLWYEPTSFHQKPSSRIHNKHSP